MTTPAFFRKLFIAGLGWHALMITAFAIPPAMTVEEAKDFWAFKKPADVAPPMVKDEASVQPLDRFIVAKLEAAGLAPAPQAEKHVLLRRLYFDLIGLPPTPEQQERFLNDADPAAFSKLVDELLASPQYGERWGRHWLDVARYADTAGDSSDYPVPQAYLYRNYVIESFNHDLPYDQFLREQIAGDLLPHADEAEMKRHVAATGFVALARRFSVEPAGAMHQTIEDVLDTTGRATMGLSLSCARCHDHKFDPISTKDYYALYGIFSSTRFPYAGSEEQRRPANLVPLVTAEKLREIEAPFAGEFKALDEGEAKLAEEMMAARNARQKKEEPPPGIRNFRELKDELKKVKEKRQAIRAKLPPMPQAFALAEGSQISDARVQKKGETFNLGEPEPRHFLTVLGGQILPAGENGSGRRQLADWIATADNPLTARVMVNRLWQQHFGRGLVATPNDFGRQGRPPSHPELLDWLARRFVESNWSIKAMHRLILNSATWQQATVESTLAQNVDPENALLWSFRRLRLDAEATRDAMLAVSGLLDSSAGEGHPFPETSKWNYTQHAPFVGSYETNRRSVYVMQQRIRRDAYFASFDGADTNACTGIRQVTNTPLQLLYLLNSKFIHEQAAGLAERVRQAAPDDRARLGLLWKLALGRDVKEDEAALTLRYVAEFQAKAREQNKAGDKASSEAWQSLCRSLLASNEFVYVD